MVTPDNATLIISESFAGRLTAFDIEVDGGLSNRRTWADKLGPDAICLDATGAIWVQTADTRAHTGRDDAPGGAVVRIREGGEVLNRVEHDRPIFGCALGGSERRTLFLLAAEWRGTNGVADVVAVVEPSTCWHRRAMRTVKIASGGRRCLPQRRNGRDG